MSALALGLAALIVVGAGSAVTYALWTASARASSTVSAASLAMTATGFSSNDYTFTNHGTLARTGAFTVTNTTSTDSETAGSFAIALGYTGNAALASALKITVWAETASAPCAATTAVTSPVVSGSWAAPSGSVSGTLKAGETATYCVRSSTTERSLLATPGGSVTIQPKISGTLTVGMWSTSADSVMTQQTQAIYPASLPGPASWYRLRSDNSGLCLAVNSGQTAAGTPVVDEACDTASTSAHHNKAWQLTSTDGGYYTLAPRHAPALRLGTATTAAGSAVQARSASTSGSLSWQLQLVSPGHVQLVNRQSGYCLDRLDTPATTSVEYAAVACNGSQTFTLVEFIDPVVETPKTTAKCAGNGEYLDLRWTRTSPALDSLVVYVGGKKTNTKVENWGQWAFQISANYLSQLGVPAGPSVVEVREPGPNGTSTLIISQPILIQPASYNPNHLLGYCA
jgi:hypothetical protein